MADKIIVLSNGCLVPLCLMQEIVERLENLLKTDEPAFRRLVIDCQRLKLSFEEAAAEVQNIILCSVNRNYEIISPIQTNNSLPAPTEARPPPSNHRKRKSEK